MFIPVISMTQEVAHIPRQTTGQTSHLIRFHLMNDDDILASARLLGVPQYQKRVEPPLPDEFCYRRVDLPRAIYSFDNYQQIFRVA